MVPIDTRRRIISFYKKSVSNTFKVVAEQFSIGEATVNRLVRLERETGDVVPDLSSRGRKRKVDLEWLQSHAKAFPDATLQERADAWQNHSGISVERSTMSRLLQSIGWSYKKKDAYRS